MKDPFEILCDQMLASGMHDIKHCFANASFAYRNLERQITRNPVEQPLQQLNVLKIALQKLEAHFEPIHIYSELKYRLRHGGPRYISEIFHESERVYRAYRGQTGRSGITVAFGERLYDILFNGRPEHLIFGLAYLLCSFTDGYYGQVSFWNFSLDASKVESTTNIRLACFLASGDCSLLRSKLADGLHATPYDSNNPICLFKAVIVSHYNGDVSIEHTQPHSFAVNIRLQEQQKNEEYAYLD